VAGIGCFCLVYHLGFALLWKLLFGSDVWPWPLWGRTLVFALALGAGGWAAFFVALFRPGPRRTLLLWAVLALALVGLVAWGAQTYTLLFELSFAPWA
jgi:hypothetical protein